MAEIGYLATFCAFVFMGAVVWRLSNFAIDMWLWLLQNLKQFLLKKFVVILDAIIPWFFHEK